MLKLLSMPCKLYEHMIYFFVAGSSMCRLLPRRKEVTRMEFKDWLDIICEVGTFIFAALTFFDNHK